MKHLLRNMKSLSALILAVLLFVSMSAVSFAEENIVNTEDEINSVLAKINAEYGTNFHVLSGKELTKYGLAETEKRTTTASELVDLEEALRYIAEIKIPQFENATQEALSAMERVDSNRGKTFTHSDMTAFATTADPVIATKAIDYAVAGVEAYISQDGYGNTVWGNVVNTYCFSNMYQDIWFMTLSPYVTYIDGRRTLYWSGTGDYCAYINGTQYYLYSGTQYAEMYVGNYD